MGLFFFAGSFMVMKVLREKLQRGLIEDLQLLVEGETLLRLISIGRAEKQESLQ